MLMRGRGQVEVAPDPGGMERDLGLGSRLFLFLECECRTSR